MQSPQDPRIDLAEIKLHIVKKIGVERSRRYFYYLGRFLSQKVTRSEFDKLCCRLLGRENLALHNKLIRSVLRNASLAKSSPSPQVHKTGHPEKSLVLGKEDGFEQSGSLTANHNRNDNVWSNGVIRHRPSPLGENRKVETLLNQPLCRDDKSTENGVLDPFAYQSSGRYGGERTRILPDKAQVTAPHSRADQAQEERSRLILSKSPVTAPLGVSFCSPSVGGTRRAAPVSTGTSCYDSGGLLETEMMRKRMESIAVAQGLGGVSPECSSMLNNMLDVYLKKLIKSCSDLAEARSTKLVNGVYTQSSNKQSHTRQELHQVSLLDFRVAMELNPHQLGEGWPLLRERCFMPSFEEREEL